MTDITCQLSSYLVPGEHEYPRPVPIGSKFPITRATLGAVQMRRAATQSSPLCGFSLTLFFMSLPYQNHTLLQTNKLPGHTPLSGGTSVEMAVAGGRAGEIVLDGRWKFLLVASPTATPAQSHMPSFDDSGWDAVSVPHSWQMPRSGATLTDRVTGHLLDHPIYL